MESYGQQQYPSNNNNNNSQISYYQNERKKSSTIAHMNEAIRGNEFEVQRHVRHNSSSGGQQWTQRAKSDERKKSSFADVEPNDRKEYYLKGGDEEEKKYIRENSSSSNLVDSVATELDVPELASMPIKSIIKPALKKPGVTFDEKLEVYEVKNPHYGVEIKSEKREMKKKKRDRQKEEEIILKTKSDMTAKMQSQLGYYHVSNKNFKSLFLCDKTCLILHYSEKIFFFKLNKMEF